MRNSQLRKTDRGLIRSCPIRRGWIVPQLSQVGFELCEGHLDRIEIGRVRRQISQLGAGGFDEATDVVVLVGWQIVHHDDISGAQRRDQASLQIDAEDLTVDRFVDHKGRCDGVAAQGGDEGCDLPVAMRHLADQALATRTAAAQARHIGRSAGLINEDQTARIKLPLLRLPAGAGARHVGAILLRGVNAFF